MTKVSVVILNYNGKAYLEKFLPGVIKHSREANVVVADNASSDDSVDYIKTHFPNIQLISISENHGYAGGYNRVLNQIEADYYILLNSDIEVTENWIEPIIQLMDEDHTIAAAQPKILSFNQKDHFEYAGASGGFIDSLGYPFCRGRLFDTTEVDSGQYDDERQIFWASGACLFIRSSVFHDVGGFDETFFAHMEEIDLCWRINSSGQIIKSCPQSVVYHVGAGTLAVTNPRKTFLNFTNNLALLTKNLTLSKLIWVIPLRFALDWIASLKFLLTGGVNHSLAVLKAQINYFFRLPSIWSGRNRNIKNPNPELLFPGTIVFDYFVRGKKTFSELIWG